MDTQVAEIMRLLNCSEAEAKQVIADDKRIDKGERLFEQTAEEKANSKQYRRGERPTVYTFKPRERKADTDKRELVDLLAAALKLADMPTEVTNPERQIDFTYHNRKFRVVLSAPRT